MTAGDTEQSVHRTVAVSPDFPTLDILRAVGSLAVLSTHAAFQAGDYTRHGFWGTLSARLDVGVAVFFVLSGFLLSRPYLARAAQGLPAPQAGRYYWKRLVRIYPVYLVTVVVALALLPENDGVDVGTWLRSLFLLDVYLVDELPHGLTQMWSLAAEVAFYALLPVLMAVGVRHAHDQDAADGLRTARLALLLGSMVALSLAWHAWLSDAVQEHIGGVAGNWVFAHLTWFAVGIALAWAHVAAQAADGRGVEVHRAVAMLRALGRAPGVCWVVAGGLLLVAATPLAGPTLLFIPTTAQSLTKHVLYAVIGGLVVLTGVFPDPGARVTPLVSHPFARRLGHISYSVFCIHLAVLALVWEVTGYPLFRGHGLEVWALTVVLSFVAAELLYRFVEVPGMRLRHLRPSAALRRRRRAVDMP